MNWIAFLQHQGARNDCCDFGDPVAELASARVATVVVPLLDQSVIEVSGDDAISYTHNLLTNDINKLSSDEACLAGLCTPKGRLLASLTVWRSQAGLRLALSADIAPGVLKKLAMYVLRAKVQLTDASQSNLLFGLSGPNAAPILSALSIGSMAPRKVTHFSNGSVIRLGGDRYMLATEAGSAEEIWRRLVAAGARPAGLAAWHWLEIVAGMPRITGATQEEFVPQMVNFDAVGGLSFTKGCYPGQEIVARSHYLGKVKRRMFRAHVPDAAAETQPGTSLYCAQAADQACGAVVLAAISPLGGEELLVVLQADYADTDGVHLGNPLGPTLRFLPLPYDPESGSGTTQGAPAA